MSEQCALCKREYETIYRVPNEIWTRIAPEPVGPYIEHQYGGLLCVDCAFLEAKKIGVTLLFEAEVVK